MLNCQKRKKSSRKKVLLRWWMKRGNIISSINFCLVFFALFFFFVFAQLSVVVLMSPNCHLISPFLFVSSVRRQIFFFFISNLAVDNKKNGKQILNIDILDVSPEKLVADAFVLLNWILKFVWYCNDFRLLRFRM